MIHELWLKNIGVIDSTRLELGSGLNVITGETGAGKSMLLSGLGLVLGARADKDVIRHGADTAWAQAILTPGIKASSMIADLGGELEDGECQIVRTVSARSRATVCGVPVPNTALATLAPELIVIHGQSDQHRLTQTQHQRAALDSFAGPELATLLSTYQSALNNFEAATKKLNQFETSQRERRERLILLQHTVTELGELQPEPGELSSIKNQISRVENSEMIRTSLTSAYDALNSEAGAVNLMASAFHELEKIREVDSNVAQMSDQLQTAMYQIQDVATSMGITLQDLDYGSNELNSLHERLAALQRALSHYAIGAVDDPAAELAQLLKESEAELNSLTDPQAGKEALVAEVNQAQTQLHAASKKLTDARKKAATELSKHVSHELASLAMGSAELQVQIEDRQEYASWGRDDVTYLFRAAPSVPWRGLAKSASGGELSRIMLALEVVLASKRSQNEELPTFVFDEVDAGVGGEAAIAVGHRLAQLAQFTQVIVVTHLPQVAAFASHHLVVRKSDQGGDGGTIASETLPVTQGERIQEIARMLAGDSDSPVAREHAKELLATVNMAP